MTRDRKAYFREYQRRRYAQKKQELIDNGQPSETPVFRARFRAECKRLGLDSQSKWRARALLKYRMLSEDKSPEGAYQKFLYQRAKARAAAAGIPFTLKPSDIPLPVCCGILKIKLDYAGLKDPKAQYKPSIDRVDNSCGYTPSNIQVISHRANILKRDATKAELRALGAWASAKTDE